MKCFEKKDDKYILKNSIENEIIQLQRSIDELQKKLDEKKASMLEELEQNEDLYEDFEANKIKITYIRPTSRESFDSSRFKKENLDLYNKYIKISQVKSSVRLKIDN